MSRHWKPEIVSPDWTRARAYRRGGAGKVALVLAGAVAVGLGGAFVLCSPGNGSGGKPDAPIEWNAVQAVPTRALTPDEIEWEKRGEGQPSTAPVQAEAAPTAELTNMYVIDGDTFGIGGQRIRIANIDAPETHPPRCPEEARLGLAATAKLKELLGSGSVTMSGAGRDRYGRELRIVQVNGQDVGETMIAAGLARSYAGGKKQGWC